MTSYLQKFESQPLYSSVPDTGDSSIFFAYLCQKMSRFFDPILVAQVARTFVFMSNVSSPRLK